MTAEDTRLVADMLMHYELCLQIDLHTYF